MDKSWREPISIQNSGCIMCHNIAGAGGNRGPQLTEIGDRLSEDQLVWRILNGGHNMPAYTTILKPDEVQQLVAFLETLKATQGE